MIPLFKVHYPKGIGAEIEKVFESGFITEGDKSDLFEKKFSDYVGNTNCSLVNSCTSALTLAYHMSDVKSGDEVIATPMTCMATNEPLNVAGAKIVWADVDPTTGNIDPESVRKKLSSKTKAIVGVHWAGQPFDIDSINEIAKENNLKVIEDAAHALGATYNNVQIGNHSDYVCFSFQAIKHLTTADGGAIFSKNSEDDDRLKKLRWFGLDRKYVGSKWEQDIVESGYKFHMNNINATIGLEQMKYIDNIVSSHKKNGQYYDENIDNARVKKLRRPKNCESSHWIYSLLVDSVDDFKKHMTESGIGCDPVHVRNDKYTVFADYQSKLPGCDEFCSKMVNVPVGWWLSEDDRKYIVRKINEY